MTIGKDKRPSSVVLTNDLTQLIDELAIEMNQDRSKLIRAMIEAELDRPHFLKYLALPKIRVKRLAEKLKKTAPHKVGDSLLVVDNLDHIIADD